MLKGTEQVTELESKQSDCKSQVLSTPLDSLFPEDAFSPHELYIHLRRLCSEQESRSTVAMRHLGLGFWVELCLLGSLLGLGALDAGNHGVILDVVTLLSTVQLWLPCAPSSPFCLECPHPVSQEPLRAALRSPFQATSSAHVSGATCHWHSNSQT